MTQIILPEQKIPDHRLGRHVNHDERSRNFPAAMLVGPAPTFRDRDWTVPGAPLDQGDLGSCTGNATTHLLRVRSGIATGTAHAVTAARLLESTAVRIYERATAIDNVPGQYPPEDTGSDGLSALKAAQQLGLFRGAYHWCFGINDVLGVLSNHGPVIVGVPWYAGFDRPDAKGLATISGEIRGGHEVCVHGLDWTGKRVHVINSWGSGWALRGHFYWSIDTLEQLLHEQGDAATIA